MIETYALALLGLILAQAAPGPNFLAVVDVALGHGRRLALFTVAGVATGVLVWVGAVAFGLAAVMAAAPWLLTALKLAGGAYLLLVGLRALRASLRRPDVTVASARRPMNARDAFRRGLFVVLTNPKAALMWAAIATFLFGAGLGTVGVLAFAPLAVASAALVYGVYGWLFSIAAAGRLYARVARLASGLLGAAFGLIGGRLVMDGIRDLRG